MLLARYHRSSGQIVGVWTAPHLELLLAQQAQDDAEYGSLVVPEDGEQDLQRLHERYEVQGETLVARQELTLDADTRTFLADSLDEVLVTVVPWRACTLLVNGHSVPLTDDDPTLRITSDVPQRFEIQLAPVAGYWAESLILEARDDA